MIVSDKGPQGEAELAIAIDKDDLAQGLEQRLVEEQEARADSESRTPSVETETDEMSADV